MIERDTETCPHCNKPVSYAWETGDEQGRQGFVSEPHNVLIANWVYHSECWDKMIEEHPP